MVLIVPLSKLPGSYLLTHARTHTHTYTHTEFTDKTSRNVRLLGRTHTNKHTYAQETEKTPTERLALPITGNMEYGFFTKALEKTNPMFDYKTRT